MNSSKLALFLLVGQSAERAVKREPLAAPKDSLPLSKEMDLALSLPAFVKAGTNASIVYKYLFVFENFLRDLVKETLSEAEPLEWWEKKVPQNVKDEVASSQETEETKSWMALGIRDKIFLTTYPQLLAIIDHCWKAHFESIVKDKSLVQEARHITHMRNAICHMTDIPDEEVNRIKQVLRDWFRVVAP